MGLLARFQPALYHVPGDLPVTETTHGFLCGAEKIHEQADLM